ncbi:ankyrin repeat, SAM and basic leucine zipper domain-containing protein 1-like [Linepithema humile]|uniref:ankyrin repeat, SAM and basic leucine zipper domain-containing protein 1-like n=1 Tax=Linepithema humile TaxID=83485 RepID=UPI0006239AD6|nr:PREDICTED: LOW QUALITY PROTEIN: protein TANC2-like [Linepithema humile]
MSKYKYLRPAGMSDDEDEDDDDDDLFFPKNIKEQYEVSKKDSKEEEKTIEFDDVSDYDEERILEEDTANACMKGNLDVIQKYLEKHDINKFLYTGWTLLLYAISYVQLEIIEYLLIHDADPNKHKDGFTPLMALCNTTKGTTEKSLKSLVLLIQSEANVNATNKQRETALMYACKSQDMEFVAELIKHVKDINVCDSDGRTALSYAVIANKPDIVKILLDHKADISLTDRNNLSVKDIAYTKGFTEITALLANDAEILTFCQESQISTWKDLFPDLYSKEKDVLDNDISTLLYGMGLEKYNVMFQGMDLKTFLQLTEDDLCRIGIDITVHRKQFLESLEKFHNKKWSIHSLGIIKKSDPFTIYNGVISLANAKKQIGVIASSFQYIKHSLMRAANQNIHLLPEEKIGYEEALRKTQDTLKILKDEIMHIKTLAQKIDKENDIGIPPTFISPKKSRSRWTITLGITLMIGLCLWKSYIPKLWNIRNV